MISGSLIASDFSKILVRHQLPEVGRIDRIRMDQLLILHMTLCHLWLLKAPGATGTDSSMETTPIARSASSPMLSTPIPVMRPNLAAGCIPTSSPQGIEDPVLEAGVARAILQQWTEAKIEEGPSAQDQLTWRHVAQGKRDSSDLGLITLSESISDLTVTASFLKIFKIRHHLTPPVPVRFSPFSGESLLSCRRVVKDLCFDMVAEQRPSSGLLNFATSFF